MDVLVAGIGRKYADLAASLLAKDHAVTGFGAAAHQTVETIIGDRSDAAAVAAAVRGRDAVVDAHTASSGDGLDAHFESIAGTAILLDAAAGAGVPTFVRGSTNLVMHGYEMRHAPAIYAADHPLVVSPTDRMWPTNVYGAANAFAEHLTRQYAENEPWAVAHLDTTTHDHPETVHVVRWGVLRTGPYDHPWGDAERGVDEGWWDRDEPAYRRARDRMRAAWCSVRDFGQLLDRAVTDESPGHHVHFAVSDNEARWFDLTSAIDVLEYEPADSADEWSGPPDRGQH